MADLTKRARNVLKWLNVSQPSDLAARLKADGWSLEYCLMLAPNCGQKTKSEIAQWYASGLADEREDKPKDAAGRDDQAGPVDRKEGGVMEYKHTEVAMGVTVTRAFLPKRATIIAVAQVLQASNFFEMGKTKFISEVMKASGGCVSPEAVGQIYDELAAEAF